MTDFASLGIKIDSSQARDATGDLDKLTAAGKRVETATEQLARAQAQAKQNTAAWRAEVQAGKLSQEEFNASVIRQKAAMAGVEQDYRQATAALRQLRDAQNGVAASSGAMRAGFQQAGFQVSDFFVQVAAGTGVVRALSLQAPQAIQAIAVMGAGAEQSAGKFAAFARFLGGPWGAAVTVAVSVAGLLATSLLEADEAAEQAEFSTYAFKDAQSILGQVMDLTTGKINTQSAALLALARAQALAGQIEARRQQATARGQLQDATRDRLGVQFVRTPGPIGAVPIPVNRRGAEGDIASALLDGSLSYDEAVRGLDSLRKTGHVTEQQFLDLAKSITDFGVAGENLKVFGELEKALNGDTTAISQFLRETNKEKKARKERKEGLSDEERAYQQALNAAQDYRSNLADETAEIGKNAIELHAMRTEAAAAAAEKAALKAPTEAGAKALRDEAKAIREGETAWRARRQAQADADFDTNVIRPLLDELELLGKVGPARELAALALEEEAFKARAARDGITDVNDAWERYFAWKERIINQGSALEREAESARALKEALQDLIGTVSGLGGVGGAVGGLLGILTGNTRSISGPIGELLSIGTGATVTKTDEYGNTRRVAETIGDKIAEVFDGENSTFGKTLKGVLQGAGMGLIAGQAFFGQQGTIGQLGSGIGGALGEALGEKFLTKGLESIFKGLGSAAGPLGAVLGGLLGGLAGSLFASTPKGGVTIGGVGGELGVVGTSGGNDARIAAATKSAGGIIEGLTQLADQLGASIDPSRGRVTVGMYKDNWRVSTSGNSRLGGYSGSESQNAANFGLYNFGQDAEAAALFAMQDLIRDGVLVGLRKGTETLLKNAKDLEAGVSKALAFEGVFRELDALKDPLGSALNDLTREFDRLRKIFAEAGASAAEYAQLEELLALKRQEVMDDEARRAVDKLSERNSLEVELLDLLGRKEEAVAQARQFELAGLEAALRPLQSMIYTLQDARAVMAQFEPLAADLRAFKQELLGGAGGAGGYAIAAARFRETAGLAKNGDADALGNLRSTATGFLDAARDNARSALEYQRAVGEVLGAVDNGIFAADSQIEYAQLQIDAIKANSAELLKVREQLATLMQQGNENTSALRRLWERYDGDGLTVKTDQDTPLQVEVI